MKTIQLLLGIGLLVVGFFNLTPSKIIDIIPKPVPPLVDPVLVISPIPAQDLIDLTKSVADLVTDLDDRVSVAIFINELAERLKLDKYDDIKLQSINDIMTEAGKIYFTTKISGKYPGFGDSITTLIILSTSEDDIYMTDANREDLSNTLGALSWNLIQ